jgi:hypothetical protein
MTYLCAATVILDVHINEMDMNKCRLLINMYRVALTFSVQAFKSVFVLTVRTLTLRRAAVF